MTLEEYRQYQQGTCDTCIVCKKAVYSNLRDFAMLSIHTSLPVITNYYIYFHTACFREVAGDQYVVV